MLPSDEIKRFYLDNPLQVKRNIEDVLCSKTRLKILKALIDSQQTPSEIAKIVGVNFVKTSQSLQILETEGILTHTKFGKRIRYYRFNDASPRAKAVKNLMEVFQMSEVL